MQSPSDAELLTDYATRRSEAAFARLVERYVALVHSAARRQVSDPHLAEEITQAVFILLARKAGSLGRHTVLAGWLCRTAHFAARDAQRTERRRQHREQLAATMDPTPDAAWQQLAPLLDEAVAQLREADRNAIVLRYYEQRSLDEIGAALGIGADAAQKRVARALEKLRAIFTKRGVTLTGAAIAGAVSANAIQAVPVGLAVKITAATFAGALTTATIVTYTTMNWINAKAIVVIVAAAVATGTATYFINQGEVNRLRNENQNLLARQRQTSDERDAALSAANADRKELERLRSNQSELLRLRGEVGSLRRQLSELDKVQAEKRQLRAEITSSRYQATPLPNEVEYEQEHSRAVNTVKWIGLEARIYSGDHQGQYPTNFDQLIEMSNTAFPGGKGLDDFEFVNPGLVGTNTPGKVMVRQRIPARTPVGKWSRVYGFADGSVWTETSPDGDFGTYEKKHMVLPSSERQ